MDKPGILTDVEVDRAVQLLMEVARPPHRPEILSLLVPPWAQDPAPSVGLPDDIWVHRCLCRLNQLTYEHPQASSLANCFAQASSFAARNSAAQSELGGLAARVRERLASALTYIPPAETNRFGGIFDGSVGVAYGQTTINITHNYFDQRPSLVGNNPALDAGLERLLNLFVANVSPAYGPDLDSLSARLDTRVPGVVVLQGGARTGKTALAAALASRKKAAGWKVLALSADVRLRGATTPRGLAECVGLPDNGVDRFREQAQVVDSLLIVDQLDAFAGRQDMSTVVDLLHEFAQYVSRFDRLRILFVGREEGFVCRDDVLPKANDILKLTDPALGAHVLRMGEDLKRPLA